MHLETPFINPFRYLSALRFDVVLLNLEAYEDPQLSKLLLRLAEHLLVSTQANYEPHQVMEYTKLLD